MEKSNKKVLETYEKRVVDLSRRNRLLKYPKSARAVNLSMTLEEFVEHFGLIQEFEIPFVHRDILSVEKKELEVTLNGGKQTELLPMEESDSPSQEKTPWFPPTKPEGKKLITNLTALRLDTKRKFEEHGLHTLFITVGKVQWKESQAGRGSSEVKNTYDYNAPLLLIPVIIEDKKNPKKTVVRIYDEVSDISVNKVLSLLLEKEHGSQKLMLNESLLNDLSALVNNLSEQITSIFSELHIPVTITNDIQLGQYTFYGQQIYEDIKNNEDKMLENAFLSALCSHDPLSQENLSIPIESSDNFLTTKDDFTVMDADTSQLEVIERVMNGNSLNVQGPPGTGKSQTIVNIIANLLARDKTVLLVCEKQVALEVVLNRLKEVGLDKLCLPLFKYTTDKKTFAKSIVDDRNAMSRISQDNRLEGELVHRENIIERLRQYAEALGTVVEPLDKSVFWVHGELAKHKKNTSAMIPWKGDDPLNVSYESYRNAEKILNSLEPLMKSVHDDKNLYWRVVTKEQFSPDYFSRIQLILKSSATNLRVITQNESVIASWKNISELKHYLVIAAEISDLPQLPESLVGSSLGENLISVLNDMTRVLKKFTEKEKLFNKKFVLPDKWTSFNYKSENIFDQDLELSQLNLVSSSFFEIDNLLQTSTEILNKLNLQKIKEQSFTRLLVNKDLLTVNSNISLVADWQLESSIENLTPTLKNLLVLHSKLVEIRKTIDKWGIIDETLNLKETQDICIRFNEKYNIVHRFFSGEYKNDVSKIKGWCNADSPKTFTDFKIICQGISDLLQQQTKISTLIKSFSDKYLVNGSLLAMNAIPQLDEDVKKISTFFTKNNKKEVPAEYQAFILNDVNHEIKQSFCKILSEFEREYFKILQNLPEFNIKEDLSLIDFSSFISELHEKANILCNLNNSLSTILTNSEDQPKTVNSLLSCLSEVNELTALRDEYNQLPINKFFVKPVSFYESLKAVDEFDSLVKTVTDALTLLKKINLNSSKPLTIDDVNSFIQEKSIIFDDLKSSVEDFNLNLTALDKLLITDTPLTTKWELLSLDELVFQLKEMSENDAGLATWMQFLKYQRQMNELGFGWYIRELLNDSSQKDLASLFSVTLWQSWLDLHYEKDTALRNFTLQDHKTLIKEFKDIDNKSRKINAMRILQQMSKKINEARWKYGTLERELVHQSELKKRHKPVRKLVNEIGNQILGYKRCWMMSPLTLSSYIPFGTLEFDTVIFDEASQMRVEHALGSIARAKQVIIFGDEQQLPPTSFFDVSDQEEDEENEEDYESILHATKEILPGADRLLSYHYRSKYEDLIAYSNHFIYGDELTTFPNASNVNPVEFVYLENGMFDGGKDGSRNNLEEANKVAELCINHVKEFPKKSLGVIAFSKSQEAAIRDSLTKILESHPDCIELLNESSDELERFFVKNLESVQGDERDVIILSVGYGNGKIGNPRQSFGPINTSNGYRRLNVAVTRAKEKVICVTSMKCTDIRGERSSKGAHLLQKYLEYAEFGRKQTIEASKLIQVQNGVEVDSPFEEEVERALQLAGFIVHRQVGASGYKIDLAIVNPRNEKEYLLGIECDGATYHSSYSARMNDRIRQENLERLGWKLYRIWSQHWTTHADQIVNDITRTVDQLT